MKVVRRRGRGDAPGDTGEGSEASGASLRRVLTLPWLILYGLGSTVGAGCILWPGVVIRDPGCVSKTWPNFFDVFEHL